VADTADTVWPAEQIMEIATTTTRLEPVAVCDQDRSVVPAEMVAAAPVAS
jgi:hypothetical protein